MDISISDVYTDVVRPPPGNRRMNDTLPGRISRERRGHLLLFGLDRVAKHNVSDLPTLDNLAAALGECEADDKLRRALLFAHGEHLTAEPDLANVGETSRQGWKFSGGAADSWDTSGGRRPSKPLMMTMQDYYYAVSIELMLAADINFCVSSAHFAQLEAQRGTLPFGGVTLHMHQVAGWGNAMRWLLTGDEFDTHEVYRFGLVQEVTASEDLLDHAVALVEWVTVRAPLGACATLGSARQALLGGGAVAVAASSEVARRLLGSEDAKEGLRVFQECRPGRLEGCQIGFLSVRPGYWAECRLSI